jgi:hypothetical protein
MRHGSIAPFRQKAEDVPSARPARAVWSPTNADEEGVTTTVSARTDGRSGRSLRNWLSLALFALAAVLFLAVAVFYYRDKTDEKPTPPPPAAKPGHADLKGVFDAVKAQGVDVQYLRGINAGARSEALSQPGQGLSADGHPLYVFIYDDKTSREDETADLQPDDLTILLPNGTPVPGAPHAVGGSNVYAVLLGGDADLAAKVDRAIQGLP